MTDATMSSTTGGPESRAVTITNPFAMGQGQSTGGEGLLSQIAKNTAMTVQILQSAMVGTPQERAAEQAERQAEAVERREEKAEDAETDDRGGRLKGFLSAIGGLVSGTGRQLQKLNPFSSSFAFGNIGRLLLAGGGVALIRTFGEDFVEPLANMLQEISDKGIKQTLIDIKDNIKERLEPTLKDMKESFNNFMDAVGRTIIFVKSVYTQLNDYIMSFDTKGMTVSAAGGTFEVGDGKLDMEELGLLKEDLQNKAISAIGSFFKAVFTALADKIMSSDYFMPVATALLLYGPVSSIFAFTGGAAAAGATGAAGMRGLTGMQKLSIFALLAFGIRETYKSYDEAMRETLEREKGNFEFSTFASIFLGGAKNAEGSVAAGYRQAIGGAGTGALVGMGLGSVIPGVGTIVGGAIGLIAGGVIGFLSGQAGTDRVKEIVDGLLVGFDQFITDIGNFFYDVANGFRYLVTGRGFIKGYNARKLGSTSILQDELEKEKVVLEKLQSMQAQFPELDLETDIQAQQQKVDLLGAQIIAAPSIERRNKLDAAELNLSNAELNFGKLQQRIFTGKDENGDGKPDLNTRTAMFKFSKDIGLGSAGGAFSGVKDPAAEAAIGPDGTNLDAYLYYQKAIPKLRAQVVGMKQAFTQRDLSLVESSDAGTLLNNPFVLNPGLNQIIDGGVSSGGAVVVSPTSGANLSAADISEAVAAGNSIPIIIDNKDINQVQPMTLNFDSLNSTADSTAAILGSTRLITLTGVD